MSSEIIRLNTLLISECHIVYITIQNEVSMVDMNVKNVYTEEL